ncbi:uncharacterized protein O3C94_007283 [Discoglossus pictus]
MDYTGGGAGSHEAPALLCDITLAFSEEEWLGLNAWQKELYLTVMRDTLELVTSLGYMMVKPQIFAKYETDVDVKECKSLLALDSTGETVSAPSYAIHENAFGKFLSQSTEDSLSYESAGETFSNKNSETSIYPESPEGFLIHENEIESYTDKSTEECLIHESAEEIFINKSTDGFLICESSGECFISQRSQVTESAGQMFIRKNVNDSLSAVKVFINKRAEGSLICERAGEIFINKPLEGSLIYKSADEIFINKSTEGFLISESTGESFVRQSTQRALIHENTEENFSERSQIQESVGEKSMNPSPEQSVVGITEVITDKKNKAPIKVLMEDHGESSAFLKEGTAPNIDQEMTVEGSSGKSKDSTNTFTTFFLHSHQQPIQVALFKVFHQAPVDGHSVHELSLVSFTTEPDFFRVIKVEERNGHYFLETEVKTALEGKCKTPVACPTDVDGCSNQAVLRSQEVEVFPLALLTSAPQFPLMDEGRIIAQQWGEADHSPEVDGGACWAAPVSKDVRTLDCEVSLQVTAYQKNHFTCSTCNKTFLNKLHLEVHERDHAEDSSLSHPMCDKRFGRKRYMLRQRQPKRTEKTAPDRDITDIDEDNDPIYCPSRQQKNFVCIVCGRKFRQRFGLFRHQKTHSKNKFSPKPVAPPPRKVYRLPIAKMMEQAPPGIEEGCSEMHRNLQLSTAFLQNLITSTGCFQYD